MNISNKDFYNTTFNNICEGSYIFMHDRFPCKVVKVYELAPNVLCYRERKMIAGIDILTSKKYSQVIKSNFRYKTWGILPKINTKWKLVMDIDENDNIILMEDNGEDLYLKCNNILYIKI